MKRVIIKIHDKIMHLVEGATVEEWEAKYGDEGDLWDIAFEEFLDGSVEASETIWYWYINGRCYETTESVNDEQ